MYMTYVYLLGRAIGGIAAQNVQVRVMVSVKGVVQIMPFWVSWSLVPTLVGILVAPCKIGYFTYSVSLRFKLISL